MKKYRKKKCIKAHKTFFCLIEERISKSFSISQRNGYACAYAVRTLRVYNTLHYENTPIQIYWKFHHKKNESFQVNILIFFIFLLKNIDCGYPLEPPRRGGSNEYPQSMFLSRNKKNNVYPCKPQFYYIKVGLKGV